MPGYSLSDLAKSKVHKTIDRLGLNDDDYVLERVGVIREYCLGQFALPLVATFWPFIAREMNVQDFDTTFLPSMRTIFRSIAWLP